MNLIVVYLASKLTVISSNVTHPVKTCLVLCNVMKLIEDLYFLVHDCKVILTTNPTSFAKTE